MTAPPVAPTEAPAVELPRGEVTAHRIGRGLAALCVAFTLAAVFLACLNPLPVTDFWWQLRTGEWIVRHGRIPTRDPFSWTAAGQPWVVHEWLTEVLFYLAHRWLPDGVLLLYKCGLGAAACGLVLARAWRRCGSPVLACGAALAAALVLRNYADLRPQMLSFVLLAGMLLALDEYAAGGVRWLPRVLPAVYALWANLHGGVVVGLAVLAFWLAGWAVERRLRREAGSALRPLASSAAACFLAVGLNPNGFAVYVYPFQVLGHPEVMDYISEWWSPDFHREALRPFGYLLVATFGLLAAAPGEGRRNRLGEALVLAALAHAALVAQRNTASFALAAAPAAAVALGELLRRAVAALEPAPDPGTTAWASVGGRLAAVLLAASALFWLWPPVPPARWYRYGIDHASFPHQAAARLRAGEWPGRLYNDYVWGGFLIWEAHPQRPVFIDGRAEVYYPTRAFEAEMKIHRVAAGWHEALDQWGVEVVLTERSGSLAGALRHEGGWREAFTGPVESVFVRVKG